MWPSRLLGLSGAKRNALGHETGWARGRADSTASCTARALQAAGSVRIVGWLIAPTSYAV